MKHPFSFNADVGEGVDNEKLLMPYLSSCNIACGGHAGDEKTMSFVIELAQQMGVKIGAHPSYLDRVNFGRKELHLLEEDIYQQVSHQLSVLKNIADNKGVKISYLKPHGALYHRANEDKATATTLIHVIQQFSYPMGLMGLPNSAMEAAAKAHDITYFKEAFADRKYHQNGTLVNRKHPEAVLQNNEAVLQQVKNLVFEQKVNTLDGMAISLSADSICFHGDTPNAVELIAYCFENLK